jgi:hypothetical protein
MKFTNVTKGLLAASAITMASFGANASVIAQASIDVTDLTVSIYDENEVELFANNGGFSVNDVAISFNGTSVSTTLNGNNDGDSFSTIITDPFAPLAVNLNSNQTSGLSQANASSQITGNIFTGGANGRTSGSVGVYGVSTADANSQILNNLAASFAFSTTENGFAKIDFSWFLDTYVSVFDQGGEGVADWALSISLKETGCGFSCNTLFNFNLSNLPVQTGTQNTIGDLWDQEAGDTVNSEFLALTAGTRYELQISQNSNAAALSVPEPTSIAIFGLGLLGLAGAARRRQS